MEIFPVVHINNNPNEAIVASEAAFRANADGIFLIDHNNGYNDTLPLFEIFNNIKNNNKSTTS